jgi:oxygen-dependent protoporphyrinogen oxidase
MTRVLVVGGGLSGLTAAFRLVEAGASVRVIEGADRVGGQIWTTLEQGFVIERGAEGFVFRSEAVPALAEALGMPDELMGQSVTTSYGYAGEHLEALAPGEAAAFLGFQVPRDDLGKGIRTFRRGMGSLLSALEGNLRARGVAPALGVTARAVTPDAREPSVELASGEVLRADAVIVAVPAAPLAALLGDAVEQARALADAATLSSVTVELAFPRDAIDHALDGTGFVVALEHQRHGLRACTFTTSKFAHRSPPGTCSLRLFFRPSAEDLATLDDTAWVGRAREALARVLGVGASPSHTWVSRWGNALPVIDDAHRERVSALESALAGRRTFVAGSAMHGSGIDAAVRSGDAAAAHVGALRAPE